MSLLTFQHGLVGVVPTSDDFAVVLDEELWFVFRCSSWPPQRIQEYILTLNQSYRVHDQGVTISKFVDDEVVNLECFWSGLSGLNVYGGCFRSSCEFLCSMNTILLGLHLILTTKFTLYIILCEILLLLLLDGCVIAFFMCD